MSDSQRGASLGAATGSIRIDTSQLARAQAGVKAFANGVERDFTKVDASVRKTEGSLGSITTTTQRAQSSFAGMSSGAALAGTAITVALAALVKYGTEAARIAGQNDRAEQSFVDLADGVNASSTQMLAGMRKASRGLIEDSQLVLGANQSIISGVADSTKELTDLLAVAQARAAATGRTTEEAFQRLVTGISRREVESLDELGLRFNLNDVFDDFAKGIGTTSEKLTEAQKTTAIFNRVIADSKDLVDAAANRAETAGDQYERFATSTTNAKDAVGDLINTLGAADAAGSFATGIDTITEALRRMTAELRQAKAEGAVGVGAGSNAITLPTNRQGLDQLKSSLIAGRQRVLDDIQTGARPASVTGPLLAELDDKLRAVNNTIVQFNARLAQATGRVPGAPPWMAGVNLAQGAATSNVRTDEQKAVIQSWATDIAAIERDAANQRTAATRQYESQRTQVIEQFETQISRQAADFATQRAQQEKQLADSIADIHEDAAKRLADVAQDAAQRQVKAAADLADIIADAQADAQRQAARAQRDLDRNIADMREDQAEREAEHAVDLAENIADARATSAERVAKLEADFAKERERASADHWRTMRSAASRLDANALYEEQLRWTQEVKARKEGHQEALTEEQQALQDQLAQLNESYAERLADERKALQESIDDANRAHQRQREDAQEALALRLADEQESHAKRLEEAKLADAERLAEAARADAERIEDLKTAHADQKREQDAEYALRLGRQKEDHNKQLGAMATAHDDRIKQIAEQEKTLKTDRQNAFLAQLEDFNLFHDEFLKRQKKLQEDQLKLFDAWWEAMGKRFVVGQVPSIKDPTTGVKYPAVQTPDGIGPAPDPNNPFGSKSSFYDPSVSHLATASYITPPASSGGRAGAYHSSDSSIVIEAGAVVINGVPGESVDSFAERFEQQLIKTMEKVSGRQ